MQVWVKVFPMPPEILRQLSSRRLNKLDAKHTMNNLNTIFIVEKSKQRFLSCTQKGKLVITQHALSAFQSKTLKKKKITTEVGHLSW